MSGLQKDPSTCLRPQMWTALQGSYSHVEIVLGEARAAIWLVLTRSLAPDGTRATLTWGYGHLRHQPLKQCL